MNKKRIILIAAAIVVVAGAVVWALAGGTKKQEVKYETATVSRQDISNFVTATGTIEPVTEVEVGTQVSGIIDKIYVDYNTVVKQGQLIAEMDKVTLESDLASAQATYDGAKAEYEYQESLYRRNQGLHDKQLISDTDYEQSRYDYLHAKSSFDSSRAALEKAERNLSYATITAPIDGVVISKDVEEGQTVASGFETPTLFTIAADLTQMQVVADVDEADIGGVEEGQRVEFTVERRFEHVHIEQHGGHLRGGNQCAQPRLEAETAPHGKHHHLHAGQARRAQRPHPRLALQPRGTHRGQECRDSRLRGRT